MPDEATRRERLRLFFEFELRHVALRSGSVWTSSELLASRYVDNPSASQRSSVGRIKRAQRCAYERLGFELKDELRFAGSPPLRLMLLPPRTRRST
jgi:hypothetical protein